MHESGRDLLVLRIILFYDWRWHHNKYIFLITLSLDNFVLQLHFVYPKQLNRTYLLLWNNGVSLHKSSYTSWDESLGTCRYFCDDNVSLKLLPCKLFACKNKQWELKRIKQDRWINLQIV